MAHITLSAEADIVIYSEFREKELVKQVPGTKWDKEEKVWRVPLSWGSCIALRGVFGEQLTVDENLSQWAWDDFKNRVEPASAARLALEDPELMAAEPELYPFQRSGVKFLELAKAALIADEMGSGKTIQLIRVIARGTEWLRDEDGAFPNHGPGTIPALIVCPNSMKFTWKKEFERWAPELKVVVADGTAPKRRKAIQDIAERKADVLVINWESLRLHTKLESFGNRALTDSEKELKELNHIEWSTVVADEAHKAKDPKAKQTRALWAVSRIARYRYAATGTPIANHPGELWSIMNFVSPKDFPRKTAFVERYCQLSWNSFGGMDIIGVKPQMQEEFNKIVDSRMIRRLKDIVLPYLPPKTYVIREAEMQPKQKKAYNQMADTMLAQLEGGIIAATNPLTHMTRLSQFSCAFAEVDEDNNVSLKDPSNKVDALVEILEEAEGEQVVVFAESRQLIELAATKLEKVGIRFGLVTGAIHPQERQDNIDAFQNGQLRVMLVTLGAGGEGITLTAARIAVFLQRSWSMVKNKQAEDRIHRPGQEGNVVEIIDIVTPNTIEEYRALKLADKEDRLQEVVRDDELRMMLKYRGEK